MQSLDFSFLLTQSRVFSYTHSELTALQQFFAQAQPFSHIVIDDFLNEDIAIKLYEDFPDVNADKHWIYYRHFNENKLGLNKIDNLPKSIVSFIEMMNDNKFVSLLEQLTNIPGLIPDKTIEAGGIHVAQQGGFLNIHADFSSHPKIKTWERRINAIYYLNKDWEESYGGALEFWDKDMRSCVIKISPKFNRLVLFNTTSSSYHGFPEPLNCPPGQTRKSIALYYYTESDCNKGIVSTKYQVLPTKGIKTKVANWIDNKMIYLYTVLKRKLNGRDDVMSRFLKK